MERSAEVMFFRICRPAAIAYVCLSAGVAASESGTAAPLQVSTHEFTVLAMAPVGTQPATPVPPDVTSGDLFEDDPGGAARSPGTGGGGTTGVPGGGVRSPGGGGGGVPGVIDDTLDRGTPNWDVQTRNPDASSTTSTIFFYDRAFGEWRPVRGIGDPRLVFFIGSLSFFIISLFLYRSATKLYRFILERLEQGVEETKPFNFAALAMSLHELLYPDKGVSSSIKRQIEENQKKSIFLECLLFHPLRTP